MPPCTSLPPAPVMTRRQTNPAAQPPSTATTYGRAGSCRAGLPRQSRRTFFSAWATALRPPRKPTNISVWPTYRGDSAAYTRHPPCPYDARLEQLNADTCARFDACAFSAQHRSEDARKQACNFRSSTTAASCPTLRARTGDQGLNTTRRFAPGNGSALCDLDTPGRARSTGVDARHALRVDRRKSGLLSRHRLFAHRRSLRVSRRPACAHQKKRREFLMPSG